MDDMRKKMCGAERLTKWSKKFLTPCLAVLLLLAVLLGIWRIWDVRHKSIDTADDGQMAASLLPLQNPTLISGEHGYWPDKEETSEPFAVTSQSKGAEVTRDEKPPHSQDTRGLYIALTKPMSSFDPKTRYIQGIIGACKGFEEVEIEGKKIKTLLPPSKPVIYLYPEAETEVTVRLEYKGRLTCVYPAPDLDGVWRVTARPDGTLTDRQGREYSYLFWEGASGGTPPDFSRGFVIRGSDTAAFLREKLAYMGLTPREYNEFIVYWLPRMQGNPWNLIAFQGKNYTDSAPLTVTPRPESVLRVFMAYRPLAASIVVPPQELTPFVRKGFTLVEWGGQGPDGAVQ